MKEVGLKEDFCLYFLRERKSGNVEERGRKF